MNVIIPVIVGAIIPVTTPVIMLVIVLLNGAMNMPLKMSSGSSKKMLRSPQPAGPRFSSSHPFSTPMKCRRYSVA